MLFEPRHEFLGGDSGKVVCEALRDNEVDTQSPKNFCALLRCCEIFYILPAQNTCRVRIESQNYSRCALCMSIVYKSTNDLLMAAVNTVKDADSEMRVLKLDFFERRVMLHEYKKGTAAMIGGWINLFLSEEYFLRLPIA